MSRRLGAGLGVRHSDTARRRGARALGAGRAGQAGRQARGARKARGARPAGRPRRDLGLQLGQVGCFGAPDSVFGLV